MLPTAEYLLYLSNISFVLINRRFTLTLHLKLYVLCSSHVLDKTVKEKIFNHWILFYRKTYVYTLCFLSECQRQMSLRLRPLIRDPLNLIELILAKETSMIYRFIILNHIVVNKAFERSFSDHR